MSLVYFSPVPWDSFAQRPHHFARWYHRRTGGDVLWVDPYPTRLPTWSDWKRPGVVQGAPGSEPPAWLSVRRVRAFPLEPFPGLNRINGMLWRSLRDDIVRLVLGGTAVRVVVGKPSLLALSVIESVPVGQSVYDAMDDFPAFYRGLSRVSMARREASVVRRAGRVLASSTALETRLSAVRGDVTRALNACEASSLPDMPVPHRQSCVPVFGYLGTMGGWFDWSWVRRLAEARPGYRVRLIGPLFVQPSCALPENVEILPPIDHSAAMSALVDFSVGLIPFRNNVLTESVDPIKYYEYRGAGLPVLSTPFGEMRLRQNVAGVWLGGEVDDLGALADAALHFDVAHQSTLQFRAENDWCARFDAALCDWFSCQT